jgi:zinc protease
VSCAGSSLPKPGELGIRNFNFRMRDFRTPSGLRILVQEDHSTPIAGVVNVVGVGASSDPAGREGIAHVVEHLAFRSRPTKEGLSTMWDLLERAGGVALNASTSLDTTTYFEFGPKEVLGDLIRLETARMLEPVARLDDKTLDIEREVVRNELRLRGETEVIGSLFGWMLEAVFPSGHPYHRSVIGSHDSLSNVRLADVQRFVKLHYRPDNMTMLIIGDVDLAHVEKLLDATVPQQLFGDKNNPITVPARRLPEKIADPPPSPPQSAMPEHEGAVTTPEVWIGWALPAGYGSERIMEEFVSAVVNAELGEAVREDRDIAQVSGGVIPGTQASILLCQVRLHEGKHPRDSAEHVLNQLYKLWLPSASSVEDKLQAAVFARMRIGAATSIAMGSESPIARAMATADYTHYTGDPLFFKRTIEAIADMQQSRLTDFSYKYLQRDRARFVYMKPLPPNARIATAPSGVGASDQEKGQEELKFDPAAVKEMAHSPGLAQLRSFKLPNGLEVIVGRRDAVPLVTLGLLLHGGRPVADPAVIDVGWELAQPGSKQHGQPIDYGGRVSGASGDDGYVLQMQFGSGNVANMFAILSDRVRSMRVESGSVDGVRKYVLPIVKKELARPEEVADRAFWRALYGQHPYGGRASAADLDKMKPDDIERWAHRIYDPRNAVLVVMGDVNPDDIRQLAERWLGDWQSASGGEVAPPTPPGVGTVSVHFEDKSELASPNHPRTIVTPRRGATQGEVRLGCLLPAASDGKAAATYQLMARLVGKHLFKAVRQELGASYGVRGSSDVLRGGAAHMVVEGNINNGKLAEALAVIRKYWDGLPRGEFDEQEMNLVRWDLAREFNLRFLTSGTVVRTVLEARNLGQPLESVDHYADDLAAVTKQDLQAAFAVCHQNQVLSIVGEEAIVKDAIGNAWK